MNFRLNLQELKYGGLRNLQPARLHFAPKVNVFAGDNGQGKTSLIEAIYFAATTRSFRTDKVQEILQSGESSFFVEGTFLEEGIQRKQVAAFQNGRKRYQLDGKRPSTLIQFITRTPIVVFHPGELSLVSGTATGRRLLLDRVALYLEPTSLSLKSRYTKIQRERHHLLLEKGPSCRDLDIYEKMMAESGAALSLCREKAFGKLLPHLKKAFEKMAVSDLGLEANYEAGGTTDASIFLDELKKRREADFRRRSATFGPHRDDLILFTQGRASRQHASQGQQRLLSLALKLAELECVRQARGVDPLLLLDDVSSELDPIRTGAIYDYIKTTPSQLFVTTTRPELFLTPGLSDVERFDLKVIEGSFNQQNLA